MARTRNNGPAITAGACLLILSVFILYREVCDFHNGRKIKQYVLHKKHILWNIDFTDFKYEYNI